MVKHVANKHNFKPKFQKKEADYEPLHLNFQQKWLLLTKEFPASCHQEYNLNLI